MGITARLCLWLIFAVSFALAQQHSPIVTTKLGTVRGRLVQVSSSQQVYEFTAIPFAEPPVGELRYRKPTPKNPWKDVFDATKLANVCPQLNLTGAYNNFVGAERMNPRGAMSEDCLYLNVWVPKAALDSAIKPKLAVFTWIHGGAFSAGATTIEAYNGAVMAAYNNVVVVSIQYRLGSLGFAYYGTEDMPGNMGLWDQLEALKWINQNIEAFGGNSAEVTIAGESAGGFSVSFHILSPPSRNYFKRAILQSGTALSPWAFHTAEIGAEVTEIMYRSIAEKCSKLGRSSTPDKIACLKSLPADAFIMADLAPGSYGYSPAFLPVIDGVFLPKHPKILLERGEFKMAGVLLGANKDEGSMFIGDNEMITQPNSPENPKMTLLNYTHYEELVGAAVNLIVHGPEPKHPLLANSMQVQYWITSNESINSGNDRPKGDQVIRAAIDANGDPLITCPVYNWAEMTTKFQHQAFMHVWPAWMGVMHTDDIPFVFGEPFAEYAKDYGYSENDKQLSRIMMEYWTNFVKYGNPNTRDAGATGTLQVWPSYESLDKTCSQQIFELNSDVQVHNVGNGVVCALKERQCSFWGDYFPKLVDLSRPVVSSAVSLANNWLVLFVFAILDRLLAL